MGMKFIHTRTSVRKPCIRNGFKWISFLLVFLLHYSQASSQAVLSDSQINERLQTIRQMLDRGTSTANQWWYGWLIGYSAATIGQGIVSLGTDNKAIRQDMALGAATTLLGAAGLVVAPIVPGYAAGCLDTSAEETPEKKMNKLVEAEKLLRECAEREKAGRSWKTQAITGIVNLSSGLITWFGFGRNVWAGLENFALNTVITEAQIFTQPTRAMKDYDNYLKKYAAGKEQSDHRPGINWCVNAYPGGIGVSMTF
jgi:hypothetical protein